MGESEDLRALQRRVEGWRRNGGGRGSRIPEELWRDAVAVARTAGLYATARALRFNYERLKKLAGTMEPSPGKRAMEFVTLQMPQVPAGPKVVIDLAGRDGEQMRIDVSGGSAVDVAALASAFWGRRS
ncbi:MAG: hypothetical protein Q8R92_20535 [Deltaproteobacteria bacterium]|nr:hypothetical protein [Deltaproteobacteria bacterium]